MVSFEKVIRKFQKLDEYLDILKEISQTPQKVFLNDKILLGGAKYYLQVSIESCLDVANHIIASEKFRAPQDYSDSFTVIQEQGLIASELGDKLRQMTKFRNRLVHLYGEIDDAYVYEYIKEDLRDLEEFKSIIINLYKT
ncbi:DUF86 domain-containing protein [Thermodesulfobacteriota bacterium]